MINSTRTTPRDSWRELEATSNKLLALTQICYLSMALSTTLRGASHKQQAASGKRRATSVKRQEERRATSVLYVPNHRAPSNVQRQAASRESRTMYKVLRSVKKPPVLR